MFPRNAGAPPADLYGPPAVLNLPLGRRAPGAQARHMGGGRVNPQPTKSESNSRSMRPRWSVRGPAQLHQVSVPPVRRGRHGFIGDHRTRSGSVAEQASATEPCATKPDGGLAVELATIAPELTDAGCRSGPPPAVDTLGRKAQFRPGACGDDRASRPGHGPASAPSARGEVAMAEAIRKSRRRIRSPVMTPTGSRIRAGRQSQPAPRSNRDASS